MGTVLRVLALSAAAALVGGGSDSPDLNHVAGDDASSVDDGAPDGDAGAADAPHDSPAQETGPSGIPCATKYCDPKTQVCCVILGSRTCTPIGSCSGGASMGCFDESSCPQGDICCGTIPNATLVSECAASCDAGFQLCASAAECPKGNQCVPGPGGYYQSCSPGADQ